jgi:hypothetical protein
MHFVLPPSINKHTHVADGARKSTALKAKGCVCRRGCVCNVIVDASPADGRWYVFRGCSSASSYEPDKVRVIERLEVCLTKESGARRLLTMFYTFDDGERREFVAGDARTAVEMCRCLHQHAGRDRRRQKRAAAAAHQPVLQRRRHVDRAVSARSQSLLITTLARNEEHTTIRSTISSRARPARGCNE